MAMRFNLTDPVRRDIKVVLGSIASFELAKYLYQSYTSTKKKADLPLAIIKLHHTIDNFYNMDHLDKDIFDNPKVKLVILDIDSAGGNVAESFYVYQNIKELKERYPDKKIYVYTRNNLCSGAYMIACAADGIYANQFAQIGAIGSTITTLGYQKFLDKLGFSVESHTSGDLKPVDTIVPLSEEAKEGLKNINLDIHKKFIAIVKERNPDKLHENTPRYDQVTRGAVFTPEEALEAGLIDKIGTLGDLIEDVLGITKTECHGRPFLRTSLKEDSQNALNLDIKSLISFVYHLLPS